MPHSFSSWIELAINWYWRPDFQILGKQSVSHAVPPAWALAVEFAMYVILALGAARDIKTGFLCLLAGALFHFFVAHGANERIYAVPAAALPYGIGICLYFLVKKYRTGVAGFVSIVVAVVYGVFICSLYRLPLDAAGFPYYLNIAVFAASFFFIASAIEGRSLRWVDRNLGCLSFPIYLLHYQAAFAVWIIFSTTITGWKLFLLTLPLVVELSAVFEYLNRKIVDPCRDMVRIKAPVVLGKVKDAK